MLRQDIHSSPTTIARILLLLAVLCAPASCTMVPDAAAPDDVTQISTYAALENALYDGDVTYAQLAQSGDFGIGTFDGMDGEMVALDGKFYQARYDGSVSEADPSLETPFATVTFFHPDQSVQLESPLTSYDELKAYLTSVAPPANHPYAIKIAGDFAHIKIRSVPVQSTPYPPLADVIAQQVTWDHEEISGTLVGYWFPEYLAELNAPGYHLHFISDDRQVAGHMLDCSLTGATIEIDDLGQVTLRLPQTDAFAAADFTQ